MVILHKVQIQALALNCDCETFPSFEVTRRSGDLMKQLTCKRNSLCIISPDECKNVSNQILWEISNSEHSAQRVFSWKVTFGDHFCPRGGKQRMLFGFSNGFILWTRLLEKIQVQVRSFCAPALRAHSKRALPITLWCELRLCRSVAQLCRSPQTLKVAA